MASSIVNTDKRRLSVLLLGKTGTGKSATGNTILKRKLFQSSASGGSVTASIDSGYAETDSHKLQIIDGPGLQDTDISALEDKERACQIIAKCLAECPGGINAFVLVVKYAERFTQENKETVNALKSILGENWLKQYGIVVVTNAADWYADNENRRPEDWFREQDGKFCEIFSSSCYRCVFFDNRRPNEVPGGNPVDWLISTVEKIANTQGFYTNQLFQSAEGERNRLIAKLKEPMLKPKIQEECNLLTGKIDEVLETKSPEEKQRGLKAVIKKANKLLEEIRQEDKNSGELAKLENMVLRVLKLAQETDFNRLKELGDDIEALRVKHKNRMNTADAWKFSLSGIGLLGAIAAGVATVATGGVVGLAIGATAAVSATAFTGAAGVAVYQSGEDGDHQKKMESKSKYLK